MHNMDKTNLKDENKLLPPMDEVMKRLSDTPGQGESNSGILVIKTSSDVYICPSWELGND